MPSAQELREKLLKSLRSDEVVMLGVVGPKDNHKRPMAARFRDSDATTIWFFGDNTTGLVRVVASGESRAEACYSAKGHDLFACIHGRLSVDTDRAIVEELWNSDVAAWYPGGKEDPKLVLLRFDTVEAEIWEAGSGLLASVKSMFGADPASDHERESHRTVPL
ncbi:pyridoxamine 5'-phosphate oxidase family protein [Amaricoccus sp. W119]|uniref:pyridoxamine 5'-phosphate oxidase family protein n=1 Tax=Amaricoccus sp. W119 TaxID=3391833 RepID=UPI0039A44AF0